MYPRTTPYLELANGLGQDQDNPIQVCLDLRNKQL